MAYKYQSTATISDQRKQQCKTTEWCGRMVRRMPGEREVFEGIKKKKKKRDLMKFIFAFNSSYQ